MLSKTLYLVRQILWHINPPNLSSEHTEVATRSYGCRKRQNLSDIISNSALESLIATTLNVFSPLTF